MTRHRGFVLGAVAWVVVVTAGATAVWTVISDAGAGVAGELPATNVSSTEGQQTSPRPSESVTPAPSTSEPGRPADPVRRSWRGGAGLVVGECQGAAITLISAQPSSGWSIEVDHTGPDDLRVEFENAGDERVRVEAGCLAGSPSFEVDSDRD